MLLFTGAALGIARPASAQQFKVTATGTVTRIDDIAHLYNSSVAIGTPFTFSYLFDFPAPIRYETPMSIGYLLPGANYGATAMFGDYKFAPGPTAQNYLSSQFIAGTNQLDLRSASETVTGFAVTPSNAASSISFWVPIGVSPVSTYSIIPINNAGFVNNASFSASVVASDNSTSSVGGSLNSLSAQLVDPNVAPVPEASTTTSLGLMLGLGGLVLAVRRRKSVSRSVGASAKLAALILFTGAALGIARPASAQTYKVTASGVITQIYASSSRFDSSVAVGTPYTFSCQFDYSIPGFPNGPNAVIYQSAPDENPGIGVTAAFGNYTFAPTTNDSPCRLSVYSNSGGVYDSGFGLGSFREFTTGFSSPTTSSYVGISGSSSTLSVAGYAQFPLSAYNTANFDSLNFEANISQDTQIEGSVTSLSAQLVDPNVAPVPEASTTTSLGLMLGLGGLVLAVRRRKIASR